MASRRLLSILAGGVLLAGCASAPSGPPFDPADGRVTVTFQSPEKFTDAGDRFLEHSSPKILNQLGDFLQREIRRFLPAGEKISLTFTDVDRAGDYDPLGGGRDHIRVMKSSYPPRYDFSYVRTAADGHVVAQGKEQLSDLSYSVSDNFNVQNDPLYYDKELLKKWIKATFPPEPARPPA